MRRGGTDENAIRIAICSDGIDNDCDGSLAMCDASAVAAAAIFRAEVAGDRAGRGVAGLGDVNGDGYSDIMMSAMLNDGAGTDAGAAYLFYSGSF